MLQRVVRAGLITGVIDGLFSSILVSLFYGSTVARLWQGVASTVFGQGAPASAGVLMHFGVAFAWSIVFALLYLRSAFLHSVLTRWRGVLAVACIYGPLIWLFMSLVVIPLLTKRPPNIGFRWLVQLIGHAPFVGLPIVASIREKRD